MATTPQWPGFGKRLVESIRAAGFPNVAQFADAKGYRITYAYKWASGTTPDPENLVRLTKDLGVSLEWLLLGDGVTKVPIPPRKRGVRRIVCWVAALVFGTTGMVPGQAAAQDLAREFATPAADTSYRQRRASYLWRWILGRRDTTFCVLRWGTL